MNNWKTHANLFANGKFKVETVSGVQAIQGAGHGWHQTGSATLMLSDGDIRFLDDCTLIARRIEDMKEEEEKELVEIAENISIPFQLESIRAEQRWEQDASQLLYLLSIGVYPFSQSHFDLPDDDPNKIIDIKSLSHE